MRMVAGSRPVLVIAWEWHIGLALLCVCSGALEYPTTNSCGPINKSFLLLNSVSHVLKLWEMEPAVVSWGLIMCFFWGGGGGVGGRVHIGCRLPCRCWGCSPLKQERQTWLNLQANRGHLAALFHRWHIRWHGPSVGHVALSAIHSAIYTGNHVVPAGVPALG